MSAIMHQLDAEQRSSSGVILCVRLKIVVVYHLPFGGLFIPFEVLFFSFVP